MPQVRVALSKPTHDQLKIIAIGLDTTLGGVVIQACQEYIRLMATRQYKAKPEPKTVPQYSRQKRV
jgi:hypothetical protein